jgi:hypothetical protein
MLAPRRPPGLAGLFNGGGLKRGYFLGKFPFLENFNGGGLKRGYFPQKIAFLGKVSK